MADAISNIIRRVKMGIQKEILDISFTPNLKHKTLDACILDEVVYDMLFPDLNLMGGKLRDIFLEPEWVEESINPLSIPVTIGVSYNIYRIPPHARDNRNLSSVISVTYPYGTYSAGTGTMIHGNHGQNTLGNLASSMVAAHTMQNMPVYPTPILLSGDLVKLTPNNQVWAVSGQKWCLSCRLEYDEELTNLNSSAIFSLCDLALCLTKSYIYNKLSIKMDKMYTEHGLEIGEVKNTVDGWRDELEKYNELLFKFNGSATVLDPERLGRMLSDYL